MTRTCPFHGEELRPRLCHRCARLDAERNRTKIKLQDSDRDTLEKFTDDRGRVAFRVREGRKIERPATDAWGHRKD